MAREIGSLTQIIIFALGLNCFIFFSIQGEYNFCGVESIWYGELFHDQSKNDLYNQGQSSKLSLNIDRPSKK
jgi:hypothetical protein